MIRTLAEFRAPWSRPLRVTTIVSAGVLLGTVLVGSLTGPRHLLVWWLVMVGIPLIVFTASLPFMVRGYGLTEQSIEVRRLGWTTTLPLLGLVSVTGDKIFGDYMFVKELQIGDVTLHNLAIIFADAHTFGQLGLRDKPAMLLGMNAMRAFKKVSIDFKNQKFRVVLPEHSELDVRMASAGQH